MLPQLYAADSWLVITKDQGSWISSLLALGAMAGAIPSGAMADKLGRKKSLLILGGPFLLSWGAIILAKEVWLLYIARFVAGVGVGAGCVLGPTYISEISEVSTRGTLGALFQLFLTVGIFLAFVLGSVLSYTALAIVCALIIVLFLATFYWMPESPVWLVVSMEICASSTLPSIPTLGSRVEYLRIERKKPTVLRNLRKTLVYAYRTDRLGFSPAELSSTRLPRFDSLKLMSSN